MVTTHQLQETCPRERLIQGLMNPLDKEELIHVIIRYWGLGEKRLILKERKEGNETLEWLLSSGKLVAEQDKRLYIPSKLVVYDRLMLSLEEGIRLPYLGELENTNALLINRGKEFCGIFSLQKREGDQVYLDSLYVVQAKGASFARNRKKNSIHYTHFPKGDKLLPSVTGVLAIEEGRLRFVFGQEAVDMANACYVDEGFSIFYDMKRWISDFEKEEEITD